MIPLSALEQLNGDQPIANVYHSLIASWPGAILVAPYHLVDGDFHRTTPVVPVPVGDILDALDQPLPLPIDEYLHGMRMLPAARFEAVQELLRCHGYSGAWMVCASKTLAARLLVHDSGLRLALCNALLVRGAHG